MKYSVYLGSCNAWCADATVEVDFERITFWGTGSNPTDAVSSCQAKVVEWFEQWREKHEKAQPPGLTHP